MEVLFVDNHLIAVCKSSGQPVQPEPGKPMSLEEEVKQFIKKNYNKAAEVFLGVIHRLDMPVSGITVFARTSKALERMNKLFHDRKVEKWYVAEVHGKLPEREGVLTHYLKRDEKRNMTKAFVNQAPGTQQALLEYKVLLVKPQTTLVQVHLLTGRKHQIRAQFSAVGCPIVGDLKYGSNKPQPNHRILLHAAQLEFVHPVKNEPVLIVSQPDFA